MSSDMEPPVKRVKQENNSTLINIIEDCAIKIDDGSRFLRAVISDTLLNPVPLIKVYAGHVKNPKDLSNIIIYLNEKIPLKELQHVKRVYKKDVMLCPTHFLNGVSSIREFLGIVAPDIVDAFDYFKEVEVPMVAPKVRSQYNQLVWACNFHPRKDYEKLFTDDYFSPMETKRHIRFMKIALETAKWHIQQSDEYNIFMDITNINATVVVDRTINSVVAVSFFNPDHPMQHSAMLAIDNVAKTQNGGAWTKGETTQTDPLYNNNLRGINKELLQHLKKEFVGIKFGSRPYTSKRDFTDTDEKESMSNDGPYLCTGYDIYLLKEPCLMCAMALIHARAKQVFFCFDNLQSGALKSQIKLQEVKSLNHHFDVFTGFL